LGGDVVTQTELARQLGIKRGRVTDYVKRGLPVRPDRRLWRVMALDWIRQNVALAERPSGLPEAPPALNGVGPALGPGTTFADARRLAEIAKAQRLHLAAEREKRSLLVRAEVESGLVVQGRRIRDAWLNWPARVSAILAAAWGVDAVTVQVDLDREVRAQLAALAEVALGARR
jgi:hypothetical protein